MIDLVYKHFDMNSVKIKKDIIYSYAEKKPLEMDIFYPTKNISKEIKKTVVLVHGSAPIQNIKNIEIFQSWGKLLATSGFTSIVFDWRPNIGSSDVSDLIKYIRVNANELELSADKIAIFGFSAGVEEGISQAVDVNTGFITEIVAYYGKIDNSILTETEIEKRPKILIAMGMLDDTFDINCNDELILQGKSNGWNIEKLVHSYGEHGFDAFNEGEESNEIILRTIKFLSEN